MTLAWPKLGPGPKYELLSRSQSWVFDANVRHTVPTGDTGTLWHTMAHFGTLWHTMAYYGTLYGIVWHTLAHYGILWQTIWQAPDDTGTPLMTWHRFRGASATSA